MEPGFLRGVGFAYAKESIMVDKNRVEGAGDKAKGVIKEAAGKITGDSKLKADGKADKAKGAVKSTVGGIADTVKGKN